jgi:putative ABC transport system substrate-binding protein
MKRRTLLGLTTAALVAPASLFAQRPGRVYRIGILGTSSPTPDNLNISIQPFRQGLRERGWIEGQNFVIEERWAGGKAERYPELAAELVRLKVDLIATSIVGAALAAKNATQTIPIVAALASDPVERGLAQSYARPGGNVTGLTEEAGPLDEKALEFLISAVPSAKRVAVLMDASFDSTRDTSERIALVARSLKLELRPVEVGKPEEFEGAFARMRKDRANALIVVRSLMLYVHRVRIAELAVKHRLASSSRLFEYAQAGGLMTYHLDVADNWRRAAGYVDRILRGAKPGDLPFEQPTKFLLTVNLKTARAIGLELPQSLLLRADRVIE